MAVLSHGGFPDEVALLLRTVGAGLGGPPPRAAAGLDWPLLVALVRHHRLEPLLEPALVPDAGIPERWRETLRGMRRTARMRSMRMAAEAARLTAAFAQAGIGMLVIKGPALSALLYGDPCRRFCRDLDLLVRPADEAAARSVLAECGYGRGEGMTARQSNATLLRHAGGAAPVELHVQLADDDRLFPLAALRPFHQSVTVDLGGTPVQTLGLDAALVYAACHGTAHHWSRLYWLADFSAAARHPKVDWEHVAEIGRRTGSTVKLALAAHLSQSLLGQAVMAVDQGAGRRMGGAVAVARHMLSAAPGDDLSGLRRAGVVRVLRADLAVHMGWRAAWALLCVRLRPSESDRLVVNLPPSLSFLYPAIRLYRVLGMLLRPRRG